MIRNEKDKVLEVKNLRISFKTLNGTVKAVRSISFDLYKGRTLAIVGESGSGKSVTSRAIMGLLAPNKIIEEGEILYDGKDLLRLPEDDFTEIRGSKISMIFQDPMSSLNPVMKVGKQITESMVLKAKMDVKESKSKLKYLKKRYNAFIKENAVNFDFKDTFEKIKASTSNNEHYYDNDLINLSIQILEANNSKRKEDSLKAIELLNSLITSGVFKEDEINIKEYKKQARKINATVSICENKLRRGRDVTISTFGVSLKNHVIEYKTALARESKEEKENLKREKAIAKGKKVEDNSVKKRAFASEIDTSHASIAKNTLVLIKKTIEHLEKLSTKELLEKEERAKRLIDYIQESYKKSIERHKYKEFVEEAISLMKEVGIPSPEKRVKQYPFQFSGGMRQRIVIAIALASNPQVLICDEPTTALDVTIQAQILELINRLKETRHLSIIFITHNLGVVANMADDIAVMYAGKIIEYGTVDEIFYEPKHPYTWALLASMPDLETKERLDAIPGTPPNMIIPPKGDAFAARNKYAMKIDLEKEPPLFKVSETHYAATWLLAPNAPKVEPPKLVVDRINRMKARMNESSKEESAQKAPLEKTSEKVDAKEVKKEVTKPKRKRTTRKETK